MAPETVAFALSALALACSVLSAVYSYSKTPREFAKRCLDEAASIRKAWESDVALFTAQRDSWLLEFQGLAERCDESLDRSESKRRRVAASESRRDAHAQQAPMTREQIIEAARRGQLGGTQ